MAHLIFLGSLLFLTSKEGRRREEAVGKKIYGLGRKIWNLDNIERPNIFLNKSNTEYVGFLFSFKIGFKQKA